MVTIPDLPSTSSASSPPSSLPQPALDPLSHSPQDTSPNPLFADRFLPFDPTAETGTPGVEQIDLRGLIDHTRSVSRHTLVEEVYRIFQTTKLSYLPVLDGAVPVGLCSRGQIGFLLGSQYGFALYARQTIDRHLLPRFLVVGEQEPIRGALDLSLGRLGDDFHHDVVLVDREGYFLGSIGIQTLVRVQSSLVREQVEDLARQRRNLGANNRELFRSVIELRQSQARYRILFENSTVGVGLLDASGEIETVNQSLAAWLGMELGSGGERERNLLDAFQPKERGKLLAALQQVETGHDGIVEAWLQPRADEPQRLLQIQLRTIEETGQICACCADVTRERAFTRNAIQKEKQAFLDSLVGGIAHELNNKIHPIIGFSDLLRNEREATEVELQRHYADVIYKSSADCARIVRQLLQFCKPAREEKVACDLKILAEEAIAFLHFRIREQKAVLFADFGTRPVPVLADPAQIKQIFLNLILNALDAMEKSPTRELRLSLVQREGKALLKVADTGEGIAPAIVTRIFDPFFTTKPQDKGTGLGLSVCQAIIKAHQGDIQVESTPGEGTAFTVVLPLHHTEPAPAGAAEAGMPDAPPRPALRALVIDDEPFVGGFIQEVLKRKLGCSVERALNGALAVEKLQNGEFDLIVCDILMPTMNGVEVMRWVRTHQPERLRNFLFVTGHDGGPETAAEIAAANVPVLRKPFTADLLCEQVKAFPALAGF